MSQSSSDTLETTIRNFFLYSGAVNENYAAARIFYIRQEMQHDAPDSIPTEEELFAFFQSPDEPTKLDAYQQMLATDKLLEYAEISLRTLCDLIRYQQLKEFGIVHSVKEFIRLFHLDKNEDNL